ncbi:ABC transporter substrate-binding protein [Streptomyces lunaelactis]|uniref:bifunctional serine/threonine-protein kinase/ABC transporter substrate-binding protein n=1 Tax=Streptomyces lunaelactis TaxID=1535768 RepID=UPI001585531A|nr:bifunctional serine/threonine-protein kinase/ABC transporter substrate-binding protein [Streptomyces lunaelactis]NUK10405.1 ABC transporter substrate-binding protein [Streptomyces lunaelactis]NUK24833.1 ABC transporter substrate-binding protein [Streptomyces lunaelactis]NUK70440.1 ABC transporter substrate-binding protein [Streptomyces lunaelactis]NUK76846.1 ABC transporter substrate-binding protein [Streptomyces lunaelactis]NUL10089.1 ABC transporter substrate-binding protein [Streptomyces
MRPLTADDPAGIGGHRLLGRLGAGGMGVVYLARSSGGALVALKVIRAEHAADPAFRARFEREARAASRITGRWTTPVSAADPQAREPWLATAFVPGPSLAEAVALHGPLPCATVCVLGERLAEALIEVHEAGLVHRDVKPGNVLLALDGPRLIDFGIARAAGATALTATDMVIGSPGYLSPEQAQAGRAGETGPPSDIFSLGCVLAYAASGRRPFGTGTPAAVLFRTVHEEPELDDVPGRLLPLVSACLAKDPGERPTAEDVRAGLAGPGSRSGEWLPAALPRLIAERSARVLELPDPEPQEPTQTGTGAVVLVHTRRRFLAMGGSAAGMIAVGGGIAAYLAGRPDSGGQGGQGGQGAPGPLPIYAVGLQADLTGGGRTVGRAQERGARLAVEEFSAREDRPFELTLKVLDDGGQPARARTASGRLIADRTVQAVIGPSTDATALAVAPLFHTARLPMLTVSVGTTGISSASRPACFQLRPDDHYLAVPLIHYLTVVAKSRRTAVIEDRAAGKTGWDLAQSLRESPPTEGVTTVHQVTAGSEDFGPAVAAALAARAQGVVFAGTSPHRAARCARALADAGFTGARLGVGAVLEPAFLSEAGAAAEGWAFSTTFVDPAALPGAERFVAAYRKRYGVAEVERYAVEAYDAVLLIAQAMRALGGGGVERGAMVRRLRELSYKGLAKTIAFEPLTRVLYARNGLFLHRVQGGRVRFLGPYEKVRSASP